ncbi:conserved hypothetical protein [Rubrivivax sp. A210]|uniref:hypothetical protein n=1 Tax=Rubrivivax sp. A210 TaxID=2772301 RepID=UPI0019188829|nr:hypothetical protein [Rubrivivax sp. A210]CAD5370305.1 conserved hypothetical protein [Rubrivivax sp. A210]
MHRTIPIKPVRPALIEIEPRLIGDAQDLQRVVGALETALDAQMGLREPAGAWLRELRLVDAEAELSFAPGLPYCGPELMQAAFDTLRTLLPDTDIYVRTARA